MELFKRPTEPVSDCAPDKRLKQTVKGDIEASAIADAASSARTGSEVSTGNEFKLGETWEESRTGTRESESSARTFTDSSERTMSEMSCCSENDNREPSKHELERAELVRGLDMIVNANDGHVAEQLDQLLKREDKSLSEICQIPMDDDENGLVYMAAKGGKVRLLNELWKRDQGLFQLPDQDGCLCFHRDLPACSYRWIIADHHDQTRLNLLSQRCENKQNTVVHILAKYGKVESLKELWMRRESPIGSASKIENLFFERNLDKDLPIHCAASQGHISVLQFLYDEYCESQSSNLMCMLRDVDNDKHCAPVDYQEVQPWMDVLEQYREVQNDDVRVFSKSLNRIGVLKGKEKLAVELKFVLRRAVQQGQVNVLELLFDFDNSVFADFPRSVRGDMISTRVCAWHNLELAIKRGDCVAIKRILTIGNPIFTHDISRFLDDLPSIASSLLAGTVLEDVLTALANPTPPNSNECFLFSATNSRKCTLLHALASSGISRAMKHVAGMLAHSKCSNEVLCRVNATGKNMVHFYAEKNSSYLKDDFLFLETLREIWPQNCPQDLRSLATARTNAEAPQCWTPTHCAAHSGNAAAMRFLCNFLDAGELFQPTTGRYDVWRGIYLGSHALHIAVTKDHFDCAKLLLNVPGVKSALSVANCKGHLLTHLAMSTARNTLLFLDLFWQTCTCDQSPADSEAGILLAVNSILAKDNSHRTCVHVAAAELNPEGLEWLVQKLNDWGGGGSEGGGSVGNGNTTAINMAAAAMHLDWDQDENQDTPAHLLVSAAVRWRVREGWLRFKNCFKHVKRCPALRAGFEKKNLRGQTPFEIAVAAFLETETRSQGDDPRWVIAEVLSILADPQSGLPVPESWSYLAVEVERVMIAHMAPEENVLTLEIDRAHLLATSMKGLKGLLGFITNGLTLEQLEANLAPPTQQLPMLRVNFSGEPGQDAGGLLRDWLGTLGSQLFDTTPDFGLFLTGPNNRKAINPKPFIRLSKSQVGDPNRSTQAAALALPDGPPDREVLQWYFWCGMVMGIALARNVCLGVSLASVVCKQLLEMKPKLEDLEEAAPELHSRFHFLHKEAFEGGNRESLQAVIDVLYEQEEIVQRQDSDGAVSGAGRAHIPSRIKRVGFRLSQILNESFSTDCSDGRIQSTLRKFPSGMLTPDTTQLFLERLVEQVLVEDVEPMVDHLRTGLHMVLQERELKKLFPGPDGWERMQKQLAGVRTVEPEWWQRTIAYQVPGKPKRRLYPSTNEMAREGEGDHMGGVRVCESISDEARSSLEGGGNEDDSALIEAREMAELFVRAVSGEGAGELGLMVYTFWTAEKAFPFHELSRHDNQQPPLLPARELILLINIDETYRRRPTSSTCSLQLNLYQRYTSVEDLRNDLKNTCDEANSSFSMA